MDIQQTLVPYLESRTDFYAMLHKLFRYPLSEEELNALSVDEFKVLSKDLDNGLMACGFNDLYRALRRRNTGTRQTLSADFTKVFMGVATYEGFSCQPYASLFTSDENQLMGTERAAVRKIYFEHAVQLSEGIDLPEDHLAFECEFLAIMNRRVVEALVDGQKDEAIALLLVQERFVRERINPWFPRFYALASHMVDTRFYRGVLRITKSYFKETIEVIPEIIEEIEMSDQIVADIGRSL